MEKRLYTILESINDMVSFAENKNAALLVANSAATFGIFRIAVAMEDMNDWVMYYMTGMVILLGTSALFCLVSFVPRGKKLVSDTEEPGLEDNLLYYAHITRYQSEAYLKAICKSVNTPFEDTTALDMDYAEQIVACSKIAYGKYRMYSISIWITLSAFVTPFVSWYIRRRFVQ